MSYLWQSVVRIMVWHRWNSGCVAIFFQAAILWLHVVGNQTITTDTIYVNQCKHRLCSWDPPPLFKKMFSPVQIRFLHNNLYTLHTMMYTQRLLHFSFEYKITFRLWFEDSRPTRAPPVLDFFQPIKHLNCFSSQLNLPLLCFSYPFSFPQPSTVPGTQLLNVLSKQKHGCQKVEMRGERISGKERELNPGCRPGAYLG